MKADKVTRLRVDDSGVTEILNDLLEMDIKNELEGLVIIATVKDRGIRRWFFDRNRRCTTILGLIEYMKAHVLDYMREGQDYL